MSRTIVGYTRVSTEGQVSGFGLSVQKDMLEKYAQEHQYTLLKVFEDKGTSGALRDRPALLQLMNCIEETSEVSAILIPRLDRLARDLLIQEQLISDFQKKGIAILSIDEPDLCSKDPTRKLFRQMKGAISEYEKDMIAIRLTAGRLKKVESGKGYAGGNVPYGFRVSKGKYEKVPQEIEVVRRIFHLRRQSRFGKRISYAKIAEILNKEGVPRKFNAMTVHYIANNEFYKGWYSYGGVRKYDPTHKLN